MAILIDSNTRFIVQGSSGHADHFSIANLPFYASNVVGYVSLDGGGLIGGNRWLFGGSSMFATAAEAVAATGANATIVRSAPGEAAAALEAAADAGIELAVVVSEVEDELERARIRELALARGLRVVGPCAAGLITPGACQVGAMPGYIHTKGRVGILSRSGIRCHEAALQTTVAGLGQSTVVALGRNPIVAESVLDCFEMFLEDPQTEGIVLLGDAHGRIEEALAERLLSRPSNKPVVAHIEPDQTTPADRDADIWSISDAMAARKVEALRGAGVIVTDYLEEIGPIMRNLLEVKAAGYPKNRAKRDFATAIRQVEQLCYDANSTEPGPAKVIKPSNANDFATAMRQVERNCYDAL